MEYRNGYLITYHCNRTYVDMDHTLSVEEAQEMINIALDADMTYEDIRMCDHISLQCLDDGDVMYTRELFFTGGTWVMTTDNPSLHKADRFKLTIIS